MVSAVFLGILEQTQISSPRPLLSRPSLQVRIRRLFLSVAVFRVRERVHAKRAARWNREESYRSPLVHFSCFNNDRRISKRERSLFDRYALVRGERKWENNGEREKKRSFAYLFLLRCCHRRSCFSFATAAWHYCSSRWCCRFWAKPSLVGALSAP